MEAGDPVIKRQIERSNRLIEEINNQLDLLAERIAADEQELDLANSRIEVLQGAIVRIHALAAHANRGNVWEQIAAIHQIAGEHR